MSLAAEALQWRGRPRRCLRVPESVPSPICLRVAAVTNVQTRFLCSLWLGMKVFHIDLHTKHSCTVDYKVLNNVKVMEESTS